MKKIFTSLLMMLMLIVSQVLPTAALSYDESYTLAKNYFQNLSAFQSVDVYKRQVLNFISRHIVLSVLKMSQNIVGNPM